MSLHPTRRTVVRTAAWSVPAVVVTAGAPAHAASPNRTMSVVSARGTRAGTGRLVVTLDPAPSGTPVPAATFDDAGATGGSFTAAGTVGTAARYTFDFSTTSSPVPTRIAMTLAVPGYGTAATTVIMSLAGLTDEGFDDPRLNAQARVVTVDPDGKVLVGGSFTTAGEAGVARTRLARFGADGFLDPVFGDPVLSAGAVSIQAQNDGKPVVSGTFTKVGAAGLPRAYVARFTTSGAPDPTFVDPGLNAVANAVVIQPDGKIVVAGAFSQIGNGVVRGRLCRLNADGTPDTTFADPRLSSTAVALALQPDGKILVGGAFTTAGVGGQTRLRMARFHADGTLDTTFQDPGINGAVNVIVVLPDGKILAAGGFTTVQGTTRNRLARLHADGTLDTTFIDPAVNSVVYGVVVQPNGSIVVAGAFTAVGPGVRSRLARLNPDGTLDASFPNPGLASTALSLAAGPNDTVYVAGQFTAVGATASPPAYLARIHL